MYGSIRLGSVVIPVYAVRTCSGSSSSPACAHMLRSERAVSTSLSASAGPASTTITPPIRSGAVAATQYATNPPRLWPTTIGAFKWLRADVAHELAAHGRRQRRLDRALAGESGERQHVRLDAGQVRDRVVPHLAGAAEAGDEDDGAALAGHVHDERLRRERVLDERPRAGVVVGIAHRRRRAACGNHEREHDDPLHGDGCAARNVSTAAKNAPGSSSMTKCLVLGTTRSS